MITYFTLTVLFLSGIWVINLVQRQEIIRVKNSSLHTVPGPYLYKLTSLPFIYYTVIGKPHYWLHRLHLLYGPIVQFSPNHVSIITKDGIDKIYSSYQFVKSDLYQAFNFGGFNIGTMKERTQHDARKKLLTNVFSSSNLLQLENVTNEVGIEPLIKKFDELVLTHGSVDVFKLIINFYFDITGMLTLGERFDLITNGSHPITQCIKDTHKYGIIKFLFPWIECCGSWWGKRSYENVIKFCQSKYLERKGKKNPSKDILELLMTEKKVNDNISDEEIAGEIVVQFVAGIEAPGTALAWLLKLLIQHPEIMKKLQGELDKVFPNRDEKITYKQVRTQCPYLEATLYETFRLFPITGGLVPRIVPKGGFGFSGYQLPAGMEVGMAGYAYNRSPDYWKDPDNFNPERFLNDPDLLVNKSQQIPFLKGPHSCLGRELGLITLYLFVAKLFRRYNILVENPNQSFESIQYLALQPANTEIKIGLMKRP